MSSRREGLQGRLTDSYREVDRLIISVGSGVLAISVAFLESGSTPIESWAIKLSWGAMFIAVLSVLISLLFEQADKRRRINQIDADQEETDGCLDIFINAFNVIGIMTFIGGLLFLAYFRLANTK